ncbi:MAG: GNAT family N-acetyltransferase [Candidatus Hodarchaeota archaeon]
MNSTTNNTQAPQNIVIRQCTRDDLESVMAINEKTLPENYPQFFYESILERFPISFLVAEDRNMGNNLVGYVMFRIERMMDWGVKFLKKGHLVSIAVLKEYQKQGIGSTLLREGMRRVLEYNIDKYVLEVRITNTNAIEMYKKFKFYTEKTIPEYYRDGEDAYYMILNKDDFEN